MRMTALALAALIAVTFLLPSPAVAGCTPPLGVSDDEKPVGGCGGKGTGNRPGHGSNDETPPLVDRPVVPPMTGEELFIHIVARIVGLQ